jgi:hypothetical protein
MEAIDITLKEKLLPQLNEIKEMTEMSSRNFEDTPDVSDHLTEYIHLNTQSNILLHQRDICCRRAIVQQKSAFLKNHAHNILLMSAVLCA